MRTRSVGQRKMVHIKRSTISVCKIRGNNPNNISKPLRKDGFVMLKQYKIRVRRRRDGGLFFTIRRDLEQSACVRARSGCSAPAFSE